MKSLNIKQKLSNDKGITLVSLIVTITIVLIIAGISINTGTESLDDTRLKGFYAQLEIIQKRVDDIANTNEIYYITNPDDTKTPVYLKTSGGNDITSQQITLLQDILAEEGITTPANEFRYFTIENSKEQLDLMNIEYDVFVHFDTRTVVAEKGININGENYYVLKNNVYYVQENVTDDSRNVELNYTITKHGTSNYKIKVNPTNTNGELLTNGTLKYKKTTTKYWETANSLEIVISELVQYNIEYINDNNTVLQTITVSLNSEGNPIVTVNE